MDETKLRAEFESWVHRTLVDVTETDLERDSEIYEWDKLNIAFAAWKASREVLEIELPKRWTEYTQEAMPSPICDLMDADKVVAAIEAAGIRTK